MSLTHLATRALRRPLSTPPPLGGRIPQPLSLRTFRSTSASRDVLKELEEVVTPRELVERKRKAFEEKYGDKLKQRVEAEGVPSLDALKEKVLAPSIKAALSAKRAKEAEQAKIAEEREAVETEAREKVAEKREKAKERAAEGDRSGIKPLSSILNLPLLLLTPHDSKAISDIWTAYHTTHSTLAPSYLCATLPASTYRLMLELARANPFFVLPLPRASAGGEGEGTAFEMFYLQWLFHPPPAAPPVASGSAGDSAVAPAALPPVTSVIFTPLEEFKRAGEWAQPQLVLTHYPDLSGTHGVVLMRGEISPVTAGTGGGAGAGSDANPGFMLAQQEAQLLTLGLQRFYCAGIEVGGEGERGRKEREERAGLLKLFRERPDEWDWHRLVDMAYNGIA